MGPVDATVLARVARHELAGPLALEADLLDAAARACRRGAVPAREVALAQEGLRELRSLLDLLTAFAGPEEAPPVEPLGAVVRSVARRRPRLRLELSAGVAGHPVDGARTTSVVGNLADNAITHGGPGQVLLRARRCPRGACVAVEQEGPCPPAVRGWLAARQPPHGRQGLGLWLVGRLVAQMGGRAHVASRAGADRWAVRLSLPARPPVPAPPG